MSYSHMTAFITHSVTVCSSVSTIYPLGLHTLLGTIIVLNCFHSAFTPSQARLAHSQCTKGSIYSSAVWHIQDCMCTFNDLCWSGYQQDAKMKEYTCSYREKHLEFIAHHTVYTLVLVHRE